MLRWKGSWEGVNVQTKVPFQLSVLMRYNGQNFIFSQKSRIAYTLSVFSELLTIYTEENINFRFYRVSVQNIENHKKIEIIAFNCPNSVSVPDKGMRMSNQ